LFITLFGATYPKHQNGNNQKTGPLDYTVFHVRKIISAGELRDDFGW
jgi:hypothetical protein